MTRKEIADYTAGYDDCMADMMQTLDEIKSEIAEIENEIIKTTKCKDDMYYGTLSGIRLALEVIDRHIGGK